MALMLAICSPQPNWMPRNPKLMFQICQNVFGGFCIGQWTLTPLARGADESFDTVLRLPQKLQTRLKCHPERGRADQSASESKGLLFALQHKRRVSHPMRPCDRGQRGEAESTGLLLSPMGFSTRLVMLNCKRIVALLVVALAYALSAAAQPSVTKIEPPNWWTGFTSPVMVLLYGE